MVIGFTQRNRTLNEGDSPAFYFDTFSIYASYTSLRASEQDTDFIIQYMESVSTATVITPAETITAANNNTLMLRLGHVIMMMEPSHI